jgi:hypothetical protein
MLLLTGLCFLCILHGEYRRWTQKSTFVNCYCYALTLTVARKLQFFICTKKGLTFYRLDFVKLLPPKNFLHSGGGRYYSNDLTTTCCWQWIVTSNGPNAHMIFYRCKGILFNLFLKLKTPVSYLQCCSVKVLQPENVQSEGSSFSRKLFL